MTDTSRPTKETVRAFTEPRTHAPLDPPPTPEEIRRQLAWHLVMFFTAGRRLRAARQTGTGRCTRYPIR